MEKFESKEKLVEGTLYDTSGSGKFSEQPEKQERYDWPGIYLHGDAESYIGYDIIASNKDIPPIGKHLFSFPDGKEVLVYIFHDMHTFSKPRAFVDLVCEEVPYRGLAIFPDDKDSVDLAEEIFDKSLKLEPLYKKLNSLIKELLVFWKDFSDGNNKKAFSLYEDFKEEFMNKLSENEKDQMNKDANENLDAFEKKNEKDVLNFIVSKMSPDQHEKYETITENISQVQDNINSIFSNNKRKLDVLKDKKFNSFFGWIFLQN